jgi:hypothetical protein
VLLAEEPARRLGGVARVGILGQQHEQRPSQHLAQRGEQERQRRLRDAGTRGQRLHEGAQAVALGQLAHERGEDWWLQNRSVHDE